MFYGKNEHRVDLPNYFVYIFSILTEPLFILQYMIFCIWVVQKLESSIIGNFSSLLVIISINYFIRFYNYHKIKKMAEKEFRVKVIRNGAPVDISNKQIVPGDIYEVHKDQDIPCDSVLLTGDVVVNEVNFTG